MDILPVPQLRPVPLRRTATIENPCPGSQSRCSLPKHRRAEPTEQRTDALRDLPALKLNGGDREVETADDAVRVNGHFTSPAVATGPVTANGHNRKPLPRQSKPVLAPEASAALRDQLLAEMANMTGAEELSGWAHRNLPAKNKLTSADAQLVERAFGSKLNALPGDQEPEIGRASCTERVQIPVVAA